MAKISKTFEFTYDLPKIRIAEGHASCLAITLNVLATVSFHGGALHNSDNYTLENLHAVVYDGKNIAGVIRHTDLLEEIEADALAQAMDLFTDKSAAA